MCLNGIHVIRGPQNGLHGSAPTPKVEIWANISNGIVLPKFEIKLFAWTDTSIFLKAVVVTSNKTDDLLDVRKGKDMHVFAVGSFNTEIPESGSPHVLMLIDAEKIDQKSL